VGDDRALCVTHLALTQTWAQKVTHEFRRTQTTG
jgi:hypothetical protein